jgi:hypothetical protein
MRRLSVLGALVAAIMASRQRCTSATEASSSLKASEAEEVDETQDVAAVGALSMVAGAADGPALEQLGDAHIEALGPRAELRSLVAGEDGRQLVGLPQDDQVAIVGRSLGCVSHNYRVPQGG